MRFVISLVRNNFGRRDAARPPVSSTKANFLNLQPPLPNDKTSTNNDIMSFEKFSERLRTLQESNTQLKTLIDRLANLEFQPGSIPLDDDEDNVKTELVSEITHIVSEGKIEAAELQDRVGRFSREGLGKNEQEKVELQRGVQRAVQELKEYVGSVKWSIIV